METGTQGSLSAPVNTLSDVLQLHRTTMVYYEDDKREWKMQRERLADLEKWVLETISPHLAEVACSPSEGVHQWYINLKNRTGVTPDVEIRSARDKYLAALQQATKPPKDVKAWVRNWEEALTRAKTVGVKVAETAIDWWDAFSNAVTIFGYGDWARSYNMVHKEEIITNTLDYRKVVNDFMDCLRLPASKPKVVAKGVFPTFGTEDGRHDEESDTNSTQSTRDDRQKSSSLVERDYRRHKRQHSDGCQLCDENHTLDRCWIAIPELKPDWAIIPEDKKKKANERMEVDPSLKRLVQALRKKHKAEKRRSNRNKAKDKPDPGKRD
ncbi:hypothetical protein VTN49DRAFT_90 [Thermomyces lanuginosus]|uniref:uncharacterized protein n=1 Tax=Thermomyces lanuginosus TaxID=5541 RepID=UPI003741F3D3